MWKRRVFAQRVTYMLAYKTNKPSWYGDAWDEMAEEGNQKVDIY